MPTKIVRWVPNVIAGIQVEGPGAAAMALVLKTVATGRISNTTAAADPDLRLPVAVGERWLGQMYVWYNGAVAADLKVHLEIPAGASGIWGVNGLAIAATTFSGDVTTESTTDFASGTPISVGGGVIDIPVLLLIPFTVTVGTTAGNLTLFWAQRVSTASLVTVQANSYIQAFRL